MPNKKGLVSISFRSKSVEEIARAARAAGLEAIECGGDVHVPHGDLDAARNAAEISKKYGLECVHYGSYYKIGYSDPELFSSVLESARVLGAPIIRVWAGQGIHPDTLPEEDYWQTHLRYGWGYYYCDRMSQRHLDGALQVCAEVSRRRWSR